MSSSNFAPAIKNDYPDPEKGCLACHKGISPIREHNSGMMLDIYTLGERMGDKNGCKVCHNGESTVEDNKAVAHTNLIRFPSSMWVNENTCGICHKDYIYNLNRNLMQTEAGKIQGALWGWGAITGYKSIYGNYAIKDEDGKIPGSGTEKYISYMRKMYDAHSYAFPDSLQLLPETDLLKLAGEPEQAVFTYIRGDCQRCHVGVRGKQRRGDYRGMGCSSCHIPYSVEGYYEGNDKTLPNDVKGHMLIHSIQSTREAKVTTNNTTYSGIPSEECSACHNRGKRVGVSFLGIMESPYNTSWDSTGDGQHKLHGKQYVHIREDAHHSLKSRYGNPTGRIGCQDCHTSIDVHGNGNLQGTTLAAIEIECTDCHGTPAEYPWELPLGFGDEYGIESENKPRGTTMVLLREQKLFGTIYPPEEGYLLTARGNPFGNVVKNGNNVVVHTAGGLDFLVPVLKNLEKDDFWRNPLEAKTSMVRIKRHIEKMECYSCHSTWAAQCYGCHVKIDYSGHSRSVDWVKSGNVHYDNGETAETKKSREPEYQPGKITEGRSYLRWEDPILGINGEGKVSPLIPGCQQITTVIGEDGKTIVSNKIWRTPGGMENSGNDGQRGIDITPAQPHTVSPVARKCVSCHANPKTLGYGIHDNKYMNQYGKDVYKDISTSTGELISKNSTPQFNAIPDLPMDLSQIVTREGKQMQTVGHHWKTSGPLTTYQREKMERVGVCIACHQDIPDGNVFMKTISTAGEMLNMVPHTDKEHSKLVNSDINLAAITRIIAPIILFLIVALIYLLVRARKKRS